MAADEDIGTALSTGRPRPDPGTDLVATVSALSRLGLADLRCAASIRLRDGSVLTTPRPGGGAPVPADLTTADLVSVGADGGLVGGRWPPPLTIAADLEIYRRRPEVAAVVHGQPMTALAFAAAGRPLAPVTHTEAALVHPHLPVHGRGALLRTDADALAFAQTLGDRPVAILPGQGSIAVGGSVAEAGMLTHQLELLAKVNEVVALQPAAEGRRRTVSEADSARIGAQKAPAADFQTFFDQVAGGRRLQVPAAASSPEPGDASEAALRDRIVAACHLLYHHGLVQSLEHVSVRLPGQDAFLMTPRTHLGRLQPEEIAAVGMDGAWRAGPLAPPPFLWLHRDIFAARPEVQAIVHTHQLLVRGLVMAGTSPAPLYRGGAHWAAAPTAVHEAPDLMFDADQRRAAIAVLGQATVLHEVSHGSDFLAGTVEEATVGALHLERQARLWMLAWRLGTPRPLAPDLVSTVAAEEPTDLDWWRYFRSELTADG
jgi:ribulose-5-phosphate 4-epimerase/fuculose-1-phosphate aldolase